MLDNDLRDAPGVETRLDSLFRERQLLSLGWANVFLARDAATASFTQSLKDALVRTVDTLLPRIHDIELRGAPSKSQSPGDSLQHGDRFRWKLSANETLPIAAVSLSHGYQSTIAWVSDLVGQLLFECPPGVRVTDMCGLVLVDELDLYLHPQWQIAIIPALRDVFPNLQFVVTTHSPVLLPTLRPLIDRVITLDFDASGSVVRREKSSDPRLLTLGQILRSYFDLPQVVDPDVRNLLAEYQALAVDANRSDDEEGRLDELTEELRDRGIVGGVVRVERAT